MVETKTENPIFHSAHLVHCSLSTMNAAWIGQLLNGTVAESILLSPQDHNAASFWANILIKLIPELDSNSRLAN